MNKTQRIIVSIVGITMILLTLLGITYAYYLTRIEGNTNTNSISITTADLKLQYAEGEDSNIDLSNIMPGTEAVKTFSVINKGNVAIDNYGVYLINVINQLSRTEDLTMSLECVSKNTETGEVSGTCTGFDVREFPKLSGMIINNGIASGITHEYELTVKYKYEEAIDQSIDMGKVIEAKVQIYNEEDVADITGSITGYSEGYTVEMHSDVKVSQIVDGEYKIAAAEPGTHELIIKDKDEIIKSRQKIVISKGESAGMDETSIDVEGTPTTVPKITITNQSKKVTLNLDVSGTNIQYNYSSSTNYDATQQGTLVNAIFTNTKANKNGTIYSETPLTTPGVSVSGFKYSTDLTDFQKHSNGRETETYTVTSSYLDYYFTYGTGYEVNETTGKITLTGVSTCKYSDADCYGNKLVGAYVSSYYYGSIAKETDTLTNTTNLSEIYKVLSATVQGNMSFKNYISMPYATEATLSKTEEDEGVTYYYRGGPKDNYVNFNGMCWRIVRIDKDGGIKLILASDRGKCDENKLNAVSGFIHTSSDNDSISTAKYGTDSLSFDIDGTAYTVSYPNYLNGTNSPQSSVHYKLNDWLVSKNFDLTKLKKLEDTDWCLGDLTNAYNSSGVLQTSSSKSILDIVSKKEMNLYFDSYMRLKGNGISVSPTLSCLDEYEKFNSYIGMITADEYVYAGGKVSTNSSTYLSENTLRYDWITSSLSFYDPDDFGFYLFRINEGIYTSTLDISYRGGYTLSQGNGGGSGYRYLTYSMPYRPVIVLKPDTFITGGDGTQTNPYVVS